MAVTKASGSITQLTASGASTAITISDAYDSDLFIEHNNGTGTITVGASIQVQTRPATSGTWYDLGGPITGNLVASSQETWTVPLPRGAFQVQVDYTVPTGSTGHTLDAESGEITGI